MQNNNKWIAWILESPTWLKGAIGLITAIITFALLFRSNYHLAVVVSGGLLIFTLFFSSLCVAFSRTPPLIEGGRGVYRYQNMRPWALGTSIFTILTSTAIFVFKPSRAFVIEGITGIMQSPASIEQLLLSTSETHYRMDAVTKNSSQQEVLITQLTAYSIGGDLKCANRSGELAQQHNRNPSNIYEFYNTVHLTRSEMEQVEFRGKAEQDEYDHPVIGSITSIHFKGCKTIALWRLQFRTDFRLPPMGFHSLVLLFPREIEYEAPIPQAAPLMDFLAGKNLIDEQLTCLTMEISSGVSYASRCYCPVDMEKDFCESLQKILVDRGMKY